MIRTDPMRTLILKFGAIGDVVMAIPAAHQLHLAAHEVDWVCGATVLPVLQLYPWINPILVDERALASGSTASRFRAVWNLWRKLAFRRYDLVATLYYDPRYKLLSLPVRAARRILLSHSDRNLRLLPGRHHTDEFARILLARADSVTPQPLAPVPADLRAIPQPLAPTHTHRIVLAPAGARNLLADDALRRWPPELYVRLAELLLARNLQVVLIGGADDAWIQPIFQHLAVTDLIGRCTLPQTLALLDSAQVLITHDTGPLHLAGITRTSIVAIFGPTDPRGRLPQRAGTVALWGGEGFACRPCYDGHSFAPCAANDCMRQVTPQMVVAETLKLLAARAAGELPSPCVVTPLSTVSPLRIIQ